MSKYTKEEIKEKVKKFKLEKSWNHLYEFPGGIKTVSNKVNSPGFNTNKWKRLDPIVESLSPKGKTMIDVGCSDGYFSIMSAKKEMSKVYGIDPDHTRIERANFAKDVYGLENTKFEVFDLYKLDEKNKFDIVLGLGLIHRVPNMDACLDKLAAIGKNIILEFKTLDSEESTYKYHGGNSKSNEWNGLHYTPTKKYVIDRMKKNGINGYHTYEDRKSGLNYKRTVMLFTEES
tara:strand:+ start:1662 stop:2357 length:696 start_codon:yes stop_codon:yes gene_type:complete